MVTRRFLVTLVNYCTVFLHKHGRFEHTCIFVCEQKEYESRLSCAWIKRVCFQHYLGNVILFVLLLVHPLHFLLFFPFPILFLSLLCSFFSLSVWASSGQLQAAQCPYRISGMEPHRLQRVCRLWSRRCHQPMGSVGGVM